MSQLNQEDILSIGFKKQNILISSEGYTGPIVMEMTENDLLIDGYEYTVDESLWYCLYLNGDDWVLSRREYPNSVVQSWRTLFTGSIDSIQQLVHMLSMDKLRVSAR